MGRGHAAVGRKQDPFLITIDKYLSMMINDLIHPHYILLGGPETRRAHFTHVYFDFSRGREGHHSTRRGRLRTPGGDRVPSEFFVRRIGHIYFSRNPTADQCDGTRDGDVISDRAALGCGNPRCRTHCGLERPLWRQAPI